MPGLPRVRFADPLSRREAEILALIANGHTTREIACRLYIEPVTVKTHVGNILRKLGAHDRAHAVAVALRAGVLPLTAVTTNYPASYRVEQAAIACALMAQAHPKETTP